MRFEKLSDACHAWVETFDAVPMSAIEKIIEYDVENDGVESIFEITPPAIGDTVYIHTDEHGGEQGEIVGTKYDGEDDLYEIKFDSEPDNHSIISADCFDVIRYNPFPMWGIMWSFSDPVDVEWANGEYLGPHLQEIADCGFRIYQSDDFGILIGIDGAGYDFYSTHFIPLYKARGLCWHETDNTAKETA
jgi:hypothetical protein